MKRFHTTIKTVDDLKTAIDNSRADGIFKNGESLEDFAASVAAYIAYCEEYGCRVLDEACPDGATLMAWFDDTTQSAPGHGVKGLITVRYEHPNGTPDWCKCDEGSLRSFMQYLDTHGCRFIAKEVDAA